MLEIKNVPSTYRKVVRGLQMSDYYGELVIDARRDILEGSEDSRGRIIDRDFDQHRVSFTLVR